MLLVVVSDLLIIFVCRLSLLLFVGVGFGINRLVFSGFVALIGSIDLLFLVAAMLAGIVVASDYLIASCFLFGFTTKLVVVGSA